MDQDADEFRPRLRQGSVRFTVAVHVPGFVITVQNGQRRHSQIATNYFQLQMLHFKLWRKNATDGEPRLAGLPAISDRANNDYRGLTDQLRQNTQLYLNCLAQHPACNSEEVREFFYPSSRPDLWAAVHSPAEPTRGSQATATTAGLSPATTPRGRPELPAAARGEQCHPDNTHEQQPCTGCGSLPAAPCVPHHKRTGSGTTEASDCSCESSPDLMPTPRYHKSRELQLTRAAKRNLAAKAAFKALRRALHLLL